MILIGQYNSSFVRRVGITLTLYGISFEHRPWSIFDDIDKIRPYNPLIRVPTLVLEGGEALITREGPSRRHVMKIAALASGLADMVTSLFCEIRLHDAVSANLVARCRTQIGATLTALETSRIAGGLSVASSQ